MSIILILIIAISIVGCGASTEVVALEPEMVEDNIEKEEVVEVNTEETDNEGTEETEIVSTENYEDMGVFYGERHKEMKILIDTDDETVFKKCYEEYKLTDSIDIYWPDGTIAGYTKPDIKATIQSKAEEEGWYFLYLGDYSRLVKAEDFDKVATLVEYYDEEAEVYVTVGEETPKEETINVAENETVKVENENPPIKQAETTTEEPTTATTATETEKYTPEEAIAVYRSIMEANGMVWNPSIKDYASWGTGFFYLDKEYVEWAANTNVESCKMGDTGGNPCTQYY